MELRIFIEKINYLHSHIPNLAILLKPLNHLINTSGTFTPTEEHQALFSRVKDAVAKFVPLSVLHPTHALHLECDASEVGIGACLLQDVSA